MKSVSVQTQLNSINIIELNVLLTYLISSSVWHLVFKAKDFWLLDPWKWTDRLSQNISAA